MKSAFIGVAAIAALALTGPAFAQDEEEPDGFQQDDMPGSEFQLDVDSDGQVEFGRESTLDKEAAEGEAPPPVKAPKPLKEGLELGPDPLDDPLDDPDASDDPDPIDDELPGEGPESLSGPDDEDPLPY